MTTRVAFLAIGGPHQVFHLAPVAAAMSASEAQAEVWFLAADHRSLDLAKQAATFYPGAKVRFDLLRRAPVAAAIARLARRAGWAKLPTLWRNRRQLAEFDAVVVAECTSTALRRMGVTRPALLCIPHGAGDRAVSFEPRFALFDRVLVAGQKTAARMIASGVDRNRVSVTGYPKADLARRMAVAPPRLFANDRPVILYNPHFRRSLSSLDAAPQIVAALAADPRFNLIVAPHLRAMEGASAKTIAQWRAMAVPDKVLVDLSSDRLVDMSYTAAADIYLGDVSSQVYEFLLTPRPCLFVNAHGVEWKNDPDYAHWQLGEVVSPEDVIAAVARAKAEHPRFLDRQQSAVAETFSDIPDAALAASRAILSALPR